MSGVAIADPKMSIARMNTAIAHRGPDGHGTWCDSSERVHFGHVRLSILDLSAAGAQPMTTPAGTTVVFNGEIYNYRELRSDLTTVDFKSNSDTEVLLHLYERHGAACLHKLNGMFGLAIWDSRREELFIARDRLGIKPLYYTDRGGIFAFSSEIKSLLTLPWVNAELDELAAYHFLTFGKLFPPRTMFKGIHKLKPGHTLTVSRKGIAVEQFWQVEYSNYDERSEEDLSLELLETLRKGVRRRLVSDVPVGAFLSGGVDSSAIVALMHEAGATDIQTYSIGFKDAASYDETQYARRIAKQFGTTHHERMVGREDIREFLPRIVDIYDEPLADSTSIPIYFLSELARQNGSIVVLTGDGADELFCGYRSWVKYARAYPFYNGYGALPRSVRKGVAHAYAAFGGQAAAIEILDRAANGRELFWGGANAFKDSVKRLVTGSMFDQGFDDVNSWDEIQPYRESFDSIPRSGRESAFVDWMCFQGITNLVPNRYLYRADRLGMAHGVELRVPFLDHEMVNFGLSVPSRMKVRKSQPKHILKRSLEPILARDVLYRRKQGFCVPLREWGGEVMFDYIDSNIDRFARDRNLLDADGVRQNLRAARAGRSGSTSALWTTYFLMAWFNKWLP